MTTAGESKLSPESADEPTRRTSFLHKTGLSLGA